MKYKVTKLREYKGHTQAIYAMCLSNRPDCFISGGGDGMVVSWNLDDEDGSMIARTDRVIYDLKRYNDSVLAACSTGELMIVEEGKGYQSIRVSDSAIYAILVMDQLIYLGGSDGFIYKLDANLSVTGKIKLSPRPIRTLYNTGLNILCGGTEGKLFTLDRDLNLITNSSVIGDTIFCIGGDSSGEKYFIGGKDAHIKVWTGNRVQQSVPAHILHVHGLDYNSEKDLLLSSSMDKTIKIWDAGKLELLKVVDFERYSAHRNSVNKILWFDKNKFISCSDDRTLMCFDLQEEE